jgi:hypothetical protein
MKDCSIAPRERTRAATARQVHWKVGKSKVGRSESGRSEGRKVEGQKVGKSKVSYCTNSKIQNSKIQEVKGLLTYLFTVLSDGQAGGRQVC